MTPGVVSKDAKRSNYQRELCGVRVVAAQSMRGDGRREGFPPNHGGPHLFVGLVVAERRTSRRQTETPDDTIFRARMARLNSTNENPNAHLCPYTVDRRVRSQSLFVWLWWRRL